MPLAQRIMAAKPIECELKFASQASDSARTVESYQSKQISEDEG